ncbi:MAG: hypothetical protein JNG88_06775 [Phycisphaerales bacterium]|nr:hypothetical protein [Phycisphaerales bacterium]
MRLRSTSIVELPPYPAPSAEMTKLLERRILQLGFARQGDLIVVVTSTRPTTPGATDTTLVHRIGAV